MCSYMLDEKLTTIYQKENVHFFLFCVDILHFIFVMVIQKKKKDRQFLCE